MIQSTSRSRESLKSLLIKLWHHLKPKRRQHFVYLLFLMIISSSLEIFSLGAVFPFLGVLVSPNDIFNFPLAQDFFKFFGINSSENLLFPITFVFIFGIVLASTCRLLLLWASTKFCFAIGADLSLDVYRKTLFQPYAIHLSRNSSEIIDSISIKINNVIYSVILPSIILLSSFILLIFILITLFLFSPLISLLTFGAFSSLYILIVFITKKKILSDGIKMAAESNNLIIKIQEGLGGIRDVLINNSQIEYLKSYEVTDRTLRNAQASSLFISQSPRFIMEAVGITFIALIAYSLSNQSGGIIFAIPLLGAFALGAQRLLPILQQAFYSWTNIKSMHPTLKQIILLLNQPLPKTFKSNISPINFLKYIRFKNVSFKYPLSDCLVLNKFNLEIPKGSRVGFVGITGSGKSTLLDILMGLLDPTSGFIEVDNVKISNKNKLGWQKHIAHVPQSIFLSDSSVKENIAFGIEKDMIDFRRVKQVAKQAQISDTIDKLPQKYDTYIGEKGVRLSGGQRQRIAIARALYKKADVIIFDEATSALDNETEEALMNAIRLLDKNITVLMIAHRISSLKYCNIIVQLRQGNNPIISSH